MSDESQEGTESPVNALVDLPIEEIRSRRAEANEIETGLSYVRRILQGRLDIVGAEQLRRRDGGDPADLAQLIAQLPQILSDHLRAPGNGRLPSTLGPGKVDDALDAQVRDLIEGFDDLPRVSDEDLETNRAALAALEQEVSQQRRALFDVIDGLQAELTRRYRTGEASVSSLLGDS